jgi:acyl-[acyl-carrier-protein]-phospholipid O-acyltransferase/long-chain-fatty-acid--[acyl-carrier-protein] ligase
MHVRVTYGEAAEQIAAGPCIVACNHLSMLDGVIVSLASPRPLFFAVNIFHAREHPLTSRLLAWMERRGLGTVVPLDSGSVFGLRRLRVALDDGHAVCIFPEGKIADAGPLPERPGLAWLQARSGCPVVRVRIEGAEHSRLFAGKGDQLWPKIRLVL